MRGFFVMIAVAAALAVASASSVLAKGHVPEHKEQVCHRGRTLTVGARAVAAHLRHGDIMLPKDDFGNIFFTGDDCSGFAPE